MKKFFAILRAVWFSFIISFRASWYIMTLRLITIAVSSFVPFINALSIKNILNSVANSTIDELWLWFTVLAITQILTAVLAKITGFLSLIHNDRITVYISMTIIEKINKLGITYFDNTELYNEVKNVTRDANSVPNLTWNVLGLIKALIQFVSAFVILSSVGWLAPIIIVVACLPNYIFDKHYSLKLYEWSRETTNDVRKINYLYSTLTEKYFSKDIRINELKDSLTEQYQSRWRTWFNSKMVISTKHFVSTFLTMFLPHILTLAFTAFIIVQTLNNQFVIGDITYYISIMGQLTSSTLTVISQATAAINNKKKLEYYTEFLNWTEETSQEEGVSIDTINEIVFDSVCFMYPGNENFALSGISFKISKGEKIAFIGKNGSGKSTIVKLILKLYQPTAGTIYINGIDINKIKTGDIYRCMSIMFQDYINYSFSLRNNLNSVNNNISYTDDELIDACIKGNSYEFVKKWKYGLETYLTRSFDLEGEELSGGQWQRLALSRSFVKEASMYIYDEPAASLDIEAERKIYRELIYNHSNKTLILISHRMSYMKEMDQIIVFDQGKVIESGTHQELMNNGGVYCNLYKIKEEVVQ